MQSLTLKSPAKLNLFLKVLNKRPDGYHNLETIFERIDLCDVVGFRSNRSGRIRIACAHPEVPLGPKNLVYKAAQLLQKEFGIREGVDIKIAKRIPVAAGLAGGSSNAATTLLGLNQVWGLGLSRQKLVELGARLGSDVPFFLYDASWALGTGRGDQIKPLDIRAKLWHIIVVPRRKMYSREVFTALNLELTKNNHDVNILLRSLRKGSLEKAARLLFNDLETSILSICPKLLTVKKRLQACDVPGVAFSGSGPAVYGLVASQEKARHLQKKLNRFYKQVFAAATL